jgi:outer membrane protein assembly factor BamB
MFRRLVSACVMVGTILVGGTVKAQRPFPSNIVPRRTSLDRLGLERHWFGVVPLVETERLLNISIAPKVKPDDRSMLFAQTSYAMIHAFDAETGQLIWSAQLGERAGWARGVAANSFAVFASNADTFFALDKKTGRPIWKNGMGTIATTEPACNEELAMVGLQTGKLYAYTLRHHDDKGNVSILTAPEEAWNWQAGGTMKTRPLPAETVVCFGSSDGKGYVVMPYERTNLFRFSTGGAIGAGLGTFGTRALLIPSADNNLYAVDIFTTIGLWTFPSGAPIDQEPAVADQDIYVINNAGNLSSLDPGTGEPRWTRSTQGGQIVSISDTKLYLRSYNLDLFIIDRKTGRVLVDPGETLLRAGLDLREYELNIVNRFNDRLYFALPSGLIVCIRESGQVNPRPLKDPAAHPFSYVPPEGIKPPLPPVATEEPKPEAGAEPGADKPDADKPDADKPDADKAKKEPADAPKDKPAEPDKEKKAPEAEKDEPK